MTQTRHGDMCSRGWNLPFTLTNDSLYSTPQTPWSLPVTNKLKKKTNTKNENKNGVKKETFKKIKK